MKIVFIGGRDIHLIGGIESYMLNLSHELVRMGHVPVVYCESDKNITVNEGGVTIIYQKGFKSNLLCKPVLGLKATVHALVNHKDLDVIHYNAWPPSLWSWIPALFGYKTLMQGHGLEWQRSKYSPFQRRILKFMEMLTAHLNRNLVMCSQDQTEYFLEQYGKTAVTIPTAVNIPVPHDNKSTILENYCLEKNGYYLFLGRLVQDKNPDYLIKAFIRSNHGNKKLVIAGSNDSNTEYVDYLKSLAKDSTDVIFTGAVYGQNKEKLLENAFFFCLPSTIEGLSIVLLEAMSYRIPVIASDIKANREPLDDNAIFVKPENIEELTLAIGKSIDFDCQTMIGNNYSKVSSQYTWDKIASMYVNYLNRLLGK